MGAVRMKRVLKRLEKRCKKYMYKSRKMHKEEKFIIPVTFPVLTPMSKDISTLGTGSSTVASIPTRHVAQHGSWLMFSKSFNN